MFSKVLPLPVICLAEWTFSFDFIHEPGVKAIRPFSASDTKQANAADKCEKSLHKGSASIIILMWAVKVVS